MFKNLNLTEGQEDLRIVDHLDLSKKSSMVSIKKLRDHLSFCPFVYFILL